MGVRADGAWCGSCSGGVGEGGAEGKRSLGGRRGARLAKVGCECAEAARRFWRPSHPPNGSAKNTAPSAAGLVQDAYEGRPAPPNKPYAYREPQPAMFRFVTCSVVTHFTPFCSRASCCALAGSSFARL